MREEGGEGKSGGQRIQVMEVWGGGGRGSEGRGEGKGGDQQEVWATRELEG